MSDCKERDDAACATADIRAWEKHLLADVDAHGFIDTWNKHVLEIGHVCAAQRIPTWQTARLLLQMVLRDTRLREVLFSASKKRVQHALRHQLLNPDFYAKKLQNWWRSSVPLLHKTYIKEITEADGSPVLVYSNRRFRNWGGTVDYIPANTFVPRSKQGVANIVRWAKKNNRRVRAAGYRHTWTSLYSNNGDVLISMLPLDVAEELPAKHPDIDPRCDLEGARIVGTINENGVTKALCRIGASTSNEQFRRWCLDEQGGQWQWTLPLNVIMVEITLGGSNAPICHGAGWKNETLSDLVTEIEFINANGDVQIVNDPQQLKAAAGCFGLLGIVTAITLKLDPMTYAVMEPYKKALPLCVPPLSRSDVPLEVDMQNISDADLQQAQQQFEKQCAQDYYSEWFWFTFQEQGWVNCWHNHGSKIDAEDYPSPTETWFQELQNHLGQLLLDFDLFELLPGDIQARMLAATAMAVLPSDKNIVTTLIDAVHFRRGVQNMSVLGMELEIPIPACADDATKPDWSVCQRAWWDAIRLVYDSARGSSNTPMRLTLEMRVMGGSSILMAPQYGNTWGTCSIEVLTHCNTPMAEWQIFKQQLLDKWMSYRDAGGALLNTRPHWAKEWEGLRVRQQPIAEHLRATAYAAVIPPFKQTLEAVAAAGNVNAAEMKKLFNNDTLSEILDWH